jgi:hypothetical protein
MLLDSAVRAERRDVVSAMLAHETATRSVRRPRRNAPATPLRRAG